MNNLILKIMPEELKFTFELPTYTRKHTSTLHIYFKVDPDTCEVVPFVPMTAYLELLKSLEILSESNAREK
jgi:hypothetical protein